MPASTTWNGKTYTASKNTSKGRVLSVCLKKKGTTKKGGGSALGQKNTMNASTGGLKVLPTSK